MIGRLESAQSQDAVDRQFLCDALNIHPTATVSGGGEQMYAWSSFIALYIAWHSRSHMTAQCSPLLYYLAFGKDGPADPALLFSRDEGAEDGTGRQETETVGVQATDTARRHDVGEGGDQVKSRWEQPPAVEMQE